VGTRPAADLHRGGLLEDVDGNGGTDVVDRAPFAEGTTRPFGGRRRVRLQRGGEFAVVDVQALFRDVT
jgi:hypothetical protein